MYDFFMLFLALAIVATVVFGLGYRSANRQPTEIAKSIRKQWPDEYHAYRTGIDEGFRQGIDAREEDE